MDSYSSKYLNDLLYLLSMWTAVLLWTQIALDTALLVFYTSAETASDGPYSDFAWQKDEIPPGTCILLSCIFHLICCKTLVVRSLCRDSIMRNDRARMFADWLSFVPWVFHWVNALLAFIGNCRGFDTKPCFHYTSPLMIVTWFWFLAAILAAVGVLVFIVFTSCSRRCSRSAVTEQDVAAVQIVAVI